jgi:hypothetical protein
MASEYDVALTTLYQAPHDGFVAERKRLAAELKAAGHKEAASKLAKLERPPISAWAVNQLYWQERKAFDALLATAESWRKGAAGAASAHRDAATGLRNKAAKILSEAGHSANEATLRRVSATLSALAAAGGFDPDPPGALRADRDPPGFGALEGAVLPSPASPPPKATKSAAKSSASKAANDDDDADDEREQQAKKAEQRRQEEERKRRQAEQKQLETEIRNAKSQVETHSRELGRLEKRHKEAETELARAQAKLEKLEAKLEALTP